MGTSPVKLNRKDLSPVDPFADIADLMEPQGAPSGLSPAQFAKLVRAKFPEYANVADDVLTRRVLQNYPEYRGQVAMPSVLGDSPAKTLSREIHSSGLRISSAKRTPERNRAVGGAPRSYHLSGEAFDVTGDPAKLDAFYNKLMDKYGGELAEVIREKDHVHVAWKYKQPTRDPFAEISDLLEPDPEALYKKFRFNAGLDEPEAIYQQFRQEAGLDARADPFADIADLLEGGSNAPAARKRSGLPIVGRPPQQQPRGLPVRVGTMQHDPADLAAAQFEVLKRAGRLPKLSADARIRLTEPLRLAGWEIGPDYIKPPAEQPGRYPLWERQLSEGFAREKGPKREAPKRPTVPFRQAGITVPTSGLGQEAMEGLDIVSRPFAYLSTLAAGTQRKIGSTVSNALQGNFSQDDYPWLDILDAAAERLTTGRVRPGYEQPVAKLYELAVGEFGGDPDTAVHKVITGTLEGTLDPTNYIAPTAVAARIAKVKPPVPFGKTPVKPGVTERLAMTEATGRRLREPIPEAATKPGDEQLRTEVEAQATEPVAETGAVSEAAARPTSPVEVSPLIPRPATEAAPKAPEVIQPAQPPLSRTDRANVSANNLSVFESAQTGDVLFVNGVEGRVVGTKGTSRGHDVITVDTLDGEIKITRANAADPERISLNKAGSAPIDISAREVATEAVSKPGARVSRLVKNPEEGIIERRNRILAEAEPPSPDPTGAKPAGLTRNFRAGSNDATVTFASETQRDLYDLAAIERKAQRGGGERGVKFSPADVERAGKLRASLTEQLGAGEGVVSALSRSVYTDVRAQMRGVRHLEERTLLDNVFAPAPPKPRAVTPRRTDTPLLTAIRQAGGINSESGSDLAAYFSNTEGQTSGLIRQGGRNVEDMFQHLREQGFEFEGYPSVESRFESYDPTRPHPSDVLGEAMFREMSGKPYRPATDTEYLNRIEREGSLHGLGIDSPSDQSRIFTALEDATWSKLLDRVLDADKPPTTQEIARFRKRSDELFISNEAVERVLGSGEFGRSPEALDFPFGAEADIPLAGKQPEAPRLTTTQIDRVREIEQRLHETGESPDKFLRQRGLTEADELTPAEADLLREMAANRKARRAPVKVEQQGIFAEGVSPTVESRAEAQAREPQRGVSGSLFAGLPEGFGSTNKIVRPEEAAKLWDEFKINQTKKRGSGGLETDDIVRLVKIGAMYVEGGVRELGEFTRRLVELGGEELRTYAPMMFARAKDYLETGRLPDVTGIKNAIVEAERRERGLAPIEQAMRKGFGQSLDEGKAIVDSDPAFRLRVERWASDPRPLTDAEDAALTYDRMKLHNEYRETTAEILRAQEAKDAPAESAAMARRELIEEQMSLNDLADKRSGTEQGRGLSARRLISKEDYSLAQLVARARTANEGKPITPEQRADLENISRKLDEAQKGIAQRDERISALEMERTAEAMRKEEQRAARKRQRQATAQELSTEFEQLTKQLTQRASRLSANPLFDPELHAIITKMTRNRVQAGVNTAEGIVESIYNAIKDSIEGITPRDVRDAISGYGRPPQRTKSELQVELARLRGEMRRLSRVEDGAPDPASVRAQRTRLARQEATLQRQLETGDFASQSTPPRRPDTETIKLRARVDDLKRQANERIKAIEQERLRAQFDPKELDKDIHFFDYLRSPLSNLNVRGVYARVGGHTGYEVSEAFRRAQVDIAHGLISRSDAIKQLRKDLAPLKKTLEAGGKPGLVRWIDEHVAAVTDPDAAFRGLAGFLKSFQYITKLRFNPRAAFINVLQPLQTLWPHLTTTEFARIAFAARSPKVRARIAEIADRESGGKIEISETGTGRYDIFGKASESNRVMGHLAGELIGQRMGLRGDELQRYAADWAKKTEFDNSRWDIPPLFRGSIAGVLGQFKPFMAKNIERLFADWKAAPQGTSTGTLARRSKMILSQVMVGGVRSVPGIKTIGGVLILGALAKSFQKTGLSEDEANKMAEAIYFGAPGLVEQDLSASVMIIDEPFGYTPSEKILNFLGGPTLGLIHAAWREGERFSGAKDTSQGTATEKREAAALRLSKAVTPLTKTGIAAYEYATGGKPSMRLGREKVPMTLTEGIGYALQGTPKRQTRFYDEREAPDWQKRMVGLPVSGEDDARQSAKRKATKALRTNPGDTAPVDALYDAGEITAAERNAIIRDAQLTPLQRLFRSQSFEDKLKMYRNASQAEKKELRPLLLEAYSDAAGHARIGKRGKLGKPRQPTVPPALLERLERQYAPELQR